ncbi:TetR/AcrR family transcriptional regulator [Nocardia sp. N2S4-5]|uniref:TetR/AcrR family transcriptional regulator n=1 Tax=Nocardia sp. N2S4-5 TaxID=3351565 RepID=UPI0037D6409F
MSPESQPAARASKRPRRADAERNRAALLAAAERLFDERGTDVPLDEVAKTAEVANATLYRHFATRADLIAAVYAEEVRDLDRLSDRLLDRTDPDQALTEWLRAFMHHVATKRDLALAIPDEPDGERDGLFAGWHAIMRAAAARLLARAQRDRAVSSELDAADLLVVVSGIALTGLPEDRLDRLLHLVRDGYCIRPAATE